MECLKTYASDIDTNFHPAIMNSEEVARYLRKSSSWVYKNWRILGGVKLRGSIFFRKENLNECIFNKRQRMEVRLHPQRQKVHKYLLQNQIRSQRGGKGKKGGDKESSKDPNRHGLLGVIK